MKRNPYKWEKSTAARYAELYWTEHGYVFSFVRNDRNKDDYVVSKNGVLMGYTILKDTVDFPAEMIKFEKMFAQYIKTWCLIHPTI